MHPFWSSHKEKRVCVSLSMGGGHGRSWSSLGGSHGEFVGEGKEREGKEEEGGAAWGWHGRGRGRHGEGSVLLGELLCSLGISCVLYVRRK
jgi:hypothetical protein